MDGGKSIWDVKSMESALKDQEIKWAVRSAALLPASGEEGRRMRRLRVCFASRVPMLPKDGSRQVGNFPVYLRNVCLLKEMLSLIAFKREPTPPQKKICNLKNGREYHGNLSADLCTLQNKWLLINQTNPNGIKRNHTTCKLLRLWILILEVKHKNFSVKISNVKFLILGAV